MWTAIKAARQKNGDNKYTNPSGPMARIEATGFESLKAGKAEDAKEKKWSARQRRKNSQGRAEFLKVSPIHDQTD